jgi:DNA-binding phage protein
MPYRDPSLSDADVYRQIRKGASPQSQQTLDNLVKALGLQKKM